MAVSHYIKGLYYITHINNVPSILERGILSHSVVEDQRLVFTPIFDGQIVSNRRDRQTPDGQTLWHFANLYFQPRNAMLYRVRYENKISDLVIFGIQPSILKKSDIFVSTGNAASYDSTILGAKDGLKAIQQMWGVINQEWWRQEDGSKRKIMAECLVPSLVEPEFIHSIFVANHVAADKVKAILPESNKTPVIPEPQMFFLPNQNIPLTKNLSLIEGDMFFSMAQTLTISVNTVGVMGKGLASRAKYQFPDVYVFYQDLCRSKILQMGKPYVYKREAFLDNELAYLPHTLSHPNSKKWFLLFPTKKHWRENSDINGIERGLQWLLAHYKGQGVKSLAVPALGCGLGLLAWQQVGPLMCKYLSQLDIPVKLYLPREQQLSADFLSRPFLLNR
jgi:O-acetyl-ADP-ribose deacetylase (regulator of RNase III)